MRSGKLKNQIEVQRVAETVNDYGTPSRTWSTVYFLWAEVLTRTAEEFMREQGASTDELVTFRTRYAEGVRTGDRVQFKGRAYDIREVTPMDRDKGLELRCVAREVQD